MYHKILVPLDGSKRAEAILPHVEELALRYKATVILLEVVELIPLISPEGTYVPLSTEIIDQNRKKVSAYLAEIEAGLRKKEIDTQSLIVDGPVVEAIIKTAEQEGADLIAMGSHGRGGISRVFYGSVAAGVLHRVDRPLLIIRSHP